MLDPTITRECINAAWGGRFRGNASDSPWHHDRCIRSLGMRRRICTCGEIVTNAVPTGRTIVLVHDVTSTLGSFLRQHWVIYAATRADGKLGFFWGETATGVKWLTPDEFALAYSAGSPSAAYVLGDGETPELSRWQRFYCWLTTL